MIATTVVGRYTGEHGHPHNGSIGLLQGKGGRRVTVAGVYFGERVFCFDEIDTRFAGVHNLPFQKEGSPYYPAPTTNHDKRGTYLKIYFSPWNQKITFFRFSLPYYQFRVLRFLQSKTYCTNRRREYPFCRCS